MTGTKGSGGGAKDEVNEGPKGAVRNGKWAHRLQPRRSRPSLSLTEAIKARSRLSQVQADRHASNTEQGRAGQDDVEATTALQYNGSLTLAYS